MSAGYKMQAEAWRKVYSELRRIYGAPFSVMGSTGLDCAINAIKDLEKRASAIDKILRALKDTRMSLNAFMEVSAAHADLLLGEAVMGEKMTLEQVRALLRGAADGRLPLPKAQDCMRLACAISSHLAQPAERVPEGWILRASNLLRDLEFSALGGRRCPCCLGWTSENGENDRRHTETCELASLIAATPAAPAEENQL